MSTDVSAVVWKRDFGTGGRKVIAARLADHADDEGRGIFPSVDKLAAECNCDRRTARRALKQFVEEGILVVVKAGGRGPSSTTRYDFDMAVLCALPLARDRIKSSEDEPETTENKGDKMPPLKKEKGGAVSKKGGTVSEKGGAVPPKPSITVNNHHSNAQARTAAADSGLEKDPEISGQSEKEIEAGFKRNIVKWPTGATDSHANGRRAWRALTDEERIAAEERLDDYIALYESHGRSRFCAFAKYCQERKWQNLPERKPEPERTHLPAAPFGKLWGACRLAELTKSPSAMPMPPDFIKRKIDAGGEESERYKRAYIARHGWPIVNRMHEQAAQGQGNAVPVDFESLAERFDKCRSDSPLFAAWKAAHEQRAWPWFGERVPEWVWLPLPVEPDAHEGEAAFVNAAIEDFKAALAASEGNSDDDCAA